MVAVSAAMGKVLVGTAGWSVPSRLAEAFPPVGSHLERYSRRFSAVEINTSFYRPHHPNTYERWAMTVPLEFRFAVKMPRVITHTRRLANAEEPLKQFLAEAMALGNKLGPLLIQLPPSLGFNSSVVTGFFQLLRAHFDGALACEPRHRTWFTDEVDRMLVDFCVARVAADPAIVPQASQPGGWPGLRYYRLHGSPRMYYSAYSSEYLATLTSRLDGHTEETWCIFDNTAEGAAAQDALTVSEGLAHLVQARSGRV